MAKTLAEQPQKVHIAEVVRHGEKIVLPENLEVADAIGVLARRLEYEEKTVTLSFDFDTFLLDGAYALAQVMKEKYGWVEGRSTPGFWSDNPPAMIGVKVGAKATDVVQVPWGRISVPGIEGYFEAAFYEKAGRFNFRLSASIKHKHEREFNAVRDAVIEYLKANSLYKGKAISVRFTDDDGDALPMPEPSFLDVSKVNESELVFCEDVEAAIQTSLFTPIQRMEQARKLKVPVKRGILLVGDFGVGKTLSAYIAAQKAINKGITFIYCQNPKEFPSIMRFAAQYSPAVVFLEDVDRIVPAQRDANVDEIINVIDGVDNKGAEIITVLTTNDVANVNVALLRPGRMDAIIHVKRPDAIAVQKLIRLYAGKLIQPEDDLTKIGELLEDNIPAVIREVCERSKLAALRYMDENETLTHIPVQALLDAAITMKMQLDLLKNQSQKPKFASQVAMEVLSMGLAQGFVQAVNLMRGTNILETTMAGEKSNGHAKPQLNP